jgi:hypothetical protein
MLVTTPIVLYPLRKAPEPATEGPIKAQTADHARLVPAPAPSR